MSQPPPALGISIGRDQLVASAYLQSHNAAVVACPPTPAIVALAPREDGSLHLECGAGGELLRFDERPGVVLHPKQLLGVPFGSPAAQAYAAGHPATKLVQRQGDLCVELELEDWVKQERTQHGLTESTMTLRPPDIVAALVADVKRRAEAQLGMGITRAVITVPPFFQDTQRQQTKDAGTLAGLQVLRIINEPTAAALAYGIDRLSNNRELHALVFNMGATTLTATALSIEDGIFEVRATRAIDLGGAQFVENMAEHCASQFQQLHGIDLRPIARSMTRIRRVCRRAMEALSQQVQVPIEVDWVHRESELDLQYTMSRARFELINNALFEQALAEADAVLRDAKIRPDQIEHVVLSGGCCNMPKIPAMFKAHLPRATVHNSIKPEEVEAYGAATQAAILCGPVVTSWWEMAPAPFWNIAGAGLYHERTCLSLTASQVDVSIVETRAEVTVTQSFINTTTNPLETTYVYPVEEGSAVFAFSADIDGRSIHAVVKEKQQAKEEYEDAISSGHGAYLLQELTGDIFQINVGNLPAGSVATIKISYACDLPLEGNDLRFSLPTFSSSKYVPQGSQTEGSTNSSVATVDAVTDITVNCTTASPLVSISSPTHPGIVTDVQGCSARVTLTASLAKEFVLKIEETAPRAPRVWIETNDDDGEPSRAAAVTLYPEFPSNSSTTSGSLPVEIVFLLDRSGSMSGSAIKQARDALMLFLKSLPGGHVSFNIVGFGSSHETLFESSVAYDDASLQKAQQHVLSLDADLGGTEILRPLEEIFRVPEKPGVPRQVILLTDGEVSNTEQVIQFVKQHSKNTRVFTLGIGAGASHRLIKGMAHAGRGSYEFVASGERIAGKVMRQLRNALQPFMTEATVSWGSLVVRDAVPQTIGPLYSGQKLTLFALLDKNSPHDADAEVRFEAQSSEGRVACSARLGGSSRGRLLHTLAAKTIISELEEEAKSLQLIDERRQQIRAHILDTSLRYGVASSEASFVAVEEREDATEGTMLSAVPEMTSCVGGAAPQKMVKTQRTSSSVNDVLLIDVCPLSLGFDVADTGLMRPVILRNTTIPCRKIQTCRALVPADGQLRFAIFEGERPLASDNSRLGELTLSLPHLANAEVPVEVTFDLDANGILHVLVLEKTTATRERLVITNDKGRLSVAEIERMVREAEAAKTADDELRRIIEAQCGGGVSAGSVAHRVTPFDQNIATASHAVKSLFAQLDERRMKKAAELEAQYIHLIALQKANGEWPLTPELCEVLRFDVKQHCPPLPMQLEPRTADTVVATLAALAFLSERVADRSEEWALLAAKANTRLLDHLLAGLAYRADVQQVIEATTAEIRRAMAANLTEAEQADAAIMTRANSVLNAVSGQLAELQDLLRSFTVAPPESPAPNAAPAPRAPTIEEVD